MGCQLHVNFCVGRNLQRRAEHLSHKNPMCWSVESSAISAVYGYGVAYYLRRRCYSRRDRWYSLFLATFTTTQLIDAFFWVLKGDSGTIPCAAIGAHSLGSLNPIISRFVIPPVIFFQPITLTLFP